MAYILSHRRTIPKGHRRSVKLHRVLPGDARFLPRALLRSNGNNVPGQAR